MQRIDERALRDTRQSVLELVGGERGVGRRERKCCGLCQSLEIALPLNSGGNGRIGDLRSRIFPTLAFLSAIAIELAPALTDESRRD
jgi:hypothetical protein